MLGITLWALHMLSTHCHQATPSFCFYFYKMTQRKCRGPVAHTSLLDGAGSEREILPVAYHPQGYSRNPAFEQGILSGGLIGMAAVAGFGTALQTHV